MYYVYLDPMKHTVVFPPKTNMDTQIMVWKRSLLENMAIFGSFCLSSWRKKIHQKLYRFTHQKDYMISQPQDVHWLDTPVMFWWGWIMSSSNHRQKISKDLETSKWRFNFWDINYLVPQIDVYKRHMFIFIMHIISTRLFCSPSRVINQASAARKTSGLRRSFPTHGGYTVYPTGIPWFQPQMIQEFPSASGFGMDFWAPKHLRTGYLEH